LCAGIPWCNTQAGILITLVQLVCYTRKAGHRSRMHSHRVNNCLPHPYPPARGARCLPWLLRNICNCAHG
jgi:hypothetical protein